MAEFRAGGCVVERVISAFDKETKAFAAEHRLSRFDLWDFRRHFGLADDDDDAEMVMEYEVGPGDAEFLSAHLPEVVTFDFDTYTYFLSCYRAE